MSRGQVITPTSAGGPPPAAVRALTEEPPYHPFILTSLGLALLAGFMLATLVPLSVVLDWGWGPRYRPLAQAHGQAQVLGWVGLFIAGMVCRLMPRFSGRPLRFPALVWLTWAALSTALVLRIVAQPAGDSWWRSSALLASGALGLVAAAAFGLVVSGTLLHRLSRAEATGHFFLLGAGAFVVQAAMNLALLSWAVQRGQETISVAHGAGLLHLQVYGFMTLFVLGVALRAVPTFSGLPRPEASAKALAWSIAGSVVVFVISAEVVAGGSRNSGLFRAEGASVAALGGLLVVGAWLVGIFRPAANRVAGASQPHVWFIRSAFAWLAVAGGLALYYGLRAAVAGEPIASEGTDAVRHAVAVGFATVMILGMAMLVVPEFAIRRMRHHAERLPSLFMLASLNTAAALRVSAAVAAPHWSGLDRYWPMAIAGGLAELALLLFLALFLQSWREKADIVALQAPLRQAG